MVGRARPVVGPVVGPVVSRTEADGLTERLARVAGALVTDGCTGAAAVLLGASVSGSDVAVAGLGVCVAGEVAGLNVATDSIAPATRHTARMLASSGMTLPCAANGAKGPVSRRSRWRRRWARISRW